MGALGHKRRGAVHEDHSMAPSRDLPEKLRDFERRRGVNHMQIFLEKLVAEILEQNGANHSVKQLIRVRELLADIIAQVQKLAQGSKGRDARELMRLREKFIMLSHADREANLPPEFRAGSVIDAIDVPEVRGRSPIGSTLMGYPIPTPPARSSFDAVLYSLLASHSPRLSVLSTAQTPRSKLRNSRTRGRGRGRGSITANKSLPDIEMSRASDIDAGTVTASPTRLAEATAEISTVAAAAEDDVEARIASSEAEARKAAEEAYEEAVKELKSEKTQNKRLRTRLQKMEQSVRSAESKAKAIEEKLTAGAGREAQMQQKLHSQELLLKAKEREIAELAPTSASLQDQSVHVSKLRVQVDENGLATGADTVEMVPALRQQVEELQEELGRRAIMIGKMEGQVAKAEAKAKSADTRIRLAEGRLAEAASTLSMVRDDNLQEEASVASLKKQLASASIKSREQQDTIDFILRNLEQMELKVAEVTVEAQIAKEKRKRAEKKLRLLQETQASKNLPLQAIGESPVDSDTAAEAIEAAEAAEAALEAKSQEVVALLQEKNEWCATLVFSAPVIAPSSQTRRVVSRRGNSHVVGSATEKPYAASCQQNYRLRRRPGTEC